MKANTLWRLRLPATLFFMALIGAACGQKPADRPAPPETAAPAPAATVAPAEDRGHTEDATSESPDSAFDHVESGEAERAASQRGHESAGEPVPANQPGSGE